MKKRTLIVDGKKTTMHAAGETFSSLNFSDYPYVMVLGKAKKSTENSATGKKW